MEHVVVIAIVFGGGFLLMVTLAGIYAWHRQQMAMLNRGGKASDQEVAALREKIDELNGLYSALALNVENLKDEVRGPGIQDRIAVKEPSNRL